ncbi:hypothetical protein SS50377_24957 [Spironucleus salmonicida]|uniref:Uncharacterized protein n=1 Tax=Spironucleus salmonicida TaxID=348837 RepID=V6LG37_9EUKA|nr:hypothetical protein SS50377_24957 [Spironucleus salmonicida]|eukprot:EST43482.1 Hypothetical protein SS50377_16853 [Spironucleus salmonicida]
MSQDEIEELEALVEALEAQNHKLQQKYDQDIIKQQNLVQVSVTNEQELLQLKESRDQYMNYCQTLEEELQLQKEQNNQLNGQLNSQKLQLLEVQQNCDNNNIQILKIDTLNQNLSSKIIQCKKQEADQELQISNLQSTIVQLQMELKQQKKLTIQNDSKFVVRRDFVIGSLKSIEPAIVKNTQMGYIEDNVQLLRRLALLVVKQ